MLTAGFSVQGASLQLLRAGERGIITRINAQQDTIAQALKTKGLILGQAIAVEQRFPQFIVRVGNATHALNDLSKQAIYVRIMNH
ncbi:MAG: ferrous iron transport protein A [Leptolyngbyaceae cyanobacterium RM1_406_9]|nr:ferrous iron transport protein A [Leptolyngbyaceae cyanobacterium RM1_406_9]